MKLSREGHDHKMQFFEAPKAKDEEQTMTIITGRLQ